MRFKYYLRGAGIGIIVATLTLMIAIHSRGGLFTEDKAITYAVQNGYTKEEAVKDASKTSSGEQSPNTQVSSGDALANTDTTASGDATDSSNQIVTKEKTTVAENENGDQITTVDRVVESPDGPEEEKEVSEKKAEDTAVAEGQNNQSVEETVEGQEEQTATENVEGQEEQAVSETAVGQTDQTAAETIEGQTDQTAAETEEGQDEQAVSFTVYSSDGSETVSARLLSQGLIDNATSFNAYLMSNHYDRVIRTGSFQIPAGAGYEEIAKIITGRS